MTTMLPTLVNQEDAALNPSYGPSIATTATADINACLIARIGWCHRQAMKALTAREAEEWGAEKQGLIDAFLGRDCRYEYQDGPVLQERYAMGLEDGRVLILAARIRPTCGHRYHSHVVQF
jgi:hypothetical protein